MRVYDTPTQWHLEPDIDPHKEDLLREQYGEKWKEKLAEEKEEFEFYNFDDDVI